MRERSEYTANEFLSTTKLMEFRHRVPVRDPWYIHPFFVTGVFVAAMVGCAYYVKHFA